MLQMLKIWRLQRTLSLRPLFAAYELVMRKLAHHHRWMLVVQIHSEMLKGVLNDNSGVSFQSHVKDGTPLFCLPDFGHGSLTSLHNFLLACRGLNRAEAAVTATLETVDHLTSPLLPERCVSPPLFIYVIFTIFL